MMRIQTLNETTKSWSYGLVLTLFLLGLPFQSTQARFKCWTNNEGVKECGDRVPPEYSQQGHQVVSKDAVLIEEQGRAKTEEELADIQRTAEEKAVAERQAKEQAKLDQVLLDTFSSEDDLLMAREGRLSSIQSRITLTESHLVKLRVSLDELISVAGDMERRGQPPTDKVVADIADVRRQIAESLDSIAAQKLEGQATEKRFELDLKRMRELRGTPSETSQQDAQL